MEASRDLPVPGQVLGGKYRIDKIIGEGAMGFVLGAFHLELEERVAIKWVRDVAVASPEAIERFLREAKLCAKIQSDHVVRVRDVARTETGAPFIVMELLEGRDLASLLIEQRRIPSATAVDYVLEACEAVAEAHTLGIVHRDLKLQNLFLARKKDGSDAVKVLDFGISKVTNAAHAMTLGAAILGSPLYMSPEQMRSSRDVDARSDIWSLGVVLFELLTGDVPFTAESLPELCLQVMSAPTPRSTDKVPDLPPGLEAIVSWTLAKSPSDRPQSVGALAQALAPFGSGRARRCVERIGRMQPAEPNAGPPPSSPAPLTPRQARTLPLSASSNGPERAAPLSAHAQTTPNWTASQGAAAPPRPSRRRWIVASACVLALGIGLIGASRFVRRSDVASSASSVPRASTETSDDRTTPASSASSADPSKDPLAAPSASSSTIIAATLDGPEAGSPVASSPPQAPAVKAATKRSKPAAVETSEPRPAAATPSTVPTPRDLGGSRR